MENRTIIGKGISYKHNIAEDKHYFGGFFNLAHNNIEQIIEEFRLRLNLPKNNENNKEFSSKEIFNNYFNKPLSITDWERGIKILLEYLPVVGCLNLSIDDDKFKDIKNAVEKEKDRRNYFTKKFNLLWDNINTFRNFYTHYYHPTITIDNSFANLLDEILLKVCKEVKQNKMKTDKTKQLLKEDLNNELKILKELKGKELKEKKSRGLIILKMLKELSIMRLFHI